MLCNLLDKHSSSGLGFLTGTTWEYMIASLLTQTELGHCEVGTDYGDRVISGRLRAQNLKFMPTQWARASDLGQVDSREPLPPIFSTLFPTLT